MKYIVVKTVVQQVDGEMDWEADVKAVTFHNTSKEVLTAIQQIRRREDWAIFEVVDGQGPEALRHQPVRRSRAALGQRASGLAYQLIFPKVLPSGLYDWVEAKSFYGNI